MVKRKNIARQRGKAPTSPVGLLEAANAHHRHAGPERWSSASFFREAKDWLPLLSWQTDLEVIRQALLERINRAHFDTYAHKVFEHELDRIIVRDAAEAFRGLLHPRSERLAGFSVLQALVETVRGQPLRSLSEAFWAEICHLVRGLNGHVRLHEDYFLKLPPRVRGRRAALLRSQELDRLGRSVDRKLLRFPDGLAEDVVFRRRQQKERILHATHGSELGWEDWRWQLRHLARSAQELQAFAPLTPDERERIQRARRKHLPFGVTPYYASLLDAEPKDGRDRALRNQVIPPESTLSHWGKDEENREPQDFMLERDTSPIDAVTRRYVGVAILKPYQSCPQICVYCQRNWEIQGPLEPGARIRPDTLRDALAWLAAHPTVREVLVTGGDPLVLSDEDLREILDELACIPHIERIRIATRMLVTLPMRFTDELCELLASYRRPGLRDLCVVTHVQHPYEVTPDMVTAVNRLRSRGVMVYNQLVFTFFVSRRFEAASLRLLLKRIGIDPYYTFYPKGKAETQEYRVPIARLLQEQKEEARLLPGMCRTDEAVYNVPGIGKNYLNSRQHRDLIGIRPDGARVYEFHPWEKKITAQKTYVGEDVAILEYLERLAAWGEDPADYESIWYYY